MEEGAAAASEKQPAPPAGTKTPSGTGTKTPTELGPDVQILLQNIKADPSLNGTPARVIRWQEEKNRWRVEAMIMKDATRAAQSR